MKVEGWSPQCTRMKVEGWSLQCTRMKVNDLKTQVGTGGMEPSVYLEKLSNLSVPWLPLLYIAIIVPT